MCVSLTRKLNSIAIFCQHLRSLQLVNQLRNFQPLLNPNFHYSAHNSPLFDPIISQHNISYFLSGRSFFIRIFPIYNYVFQVVSFLQSCAYVIPHTQYLPRPPHGPSCGHLNYTTIWQAPLKFLRYFSSHVIFFFISLDFQV